MAKPRKKKKGKGWLIFLLLVIGLLITVLFFIYKRHLQNETISFERYAVYGIDIPVGYSIHGIDVSRHQGNIGWLAVKNMESKGVKIDFAFIKATEGLGNVDKQFRRNWLKIKEAGIARGAYHFFLATKSGKAQALNFINTVKLEPGDLPPVLDIEQLYGVPPEKMRKEIKDWLNMVEAHYNVKPLIYTYVHFYEKYLGEEFDEYPLWIAHYFEKDKPRIDRKWLFWQHNDGGRVNGILPKVDFNVFNSDSAAFQRLRIN